MADLDDAPPVSKLCNQLGLPDLDKTLGNTALRYIVPILTSASRQRAHGKDGPALLREYEEGARFFSPSGIDQRLHIEYAQTFAASLPKEFAMLDLAPISPLGSNSVLSRLSQDVTLATMRGSEVVGDPTTSLSLEAASRRKRLLVTEETRGQAVHLATWHRVLRLQNFDATKGYMQHFKLFGLLSAGRDTATITFAKEAIAAHIIVWLRFVNALARDGWKITDVCVAVSDTRLVDQLIRAAGADMNEVHRRGVDEDFDLFAFCGIELPRTIGVEDELDAAQLDLYGIRHQATALWSLSQMLQSVITEAFPEVSVSIDLGRKAGLGYYSGSCYHVYARNMDGQIVQLADGGEVRWLSALLTSKKERAVSSGFGAELIQKLFMDQE
jgi:hypothetical protein